MTTTFWSGIISSAESRREKPSSSVAAVVSSSAKNSKRFQEGVKKKRRSESIEIVKERRLNILRMNEIILVMNNIKNLSMLFAKLISTNFKVVENECKELLLQALLDSYDQLIINITNNNVSNYICFDDVVGDILEEESRRKTRKIDYEVQWNMSLVGVTIMVDQNLEE
ncbi:hypothetical protein Lal_00033897 [Lupinus albus]|nr:hypothetical protein Lal_00033897 [Lupinus albus]